MCPSGYFVISPYVCAVCGTGCQQCVNATVCVVCASGYYLYSQGCALVCPNGYVSIVDGSLNNVCIQCALPCSTCSNNLPTQCTSCISGYNLYQYQCLQTCPSSYYPSPPSSNTINSTTCLPCRP